MISFVIICIVLISSRGAVSVEERNQKNGFPSTTVDFNTSIEEEDSCIKCAKWEECIPVTGNGYTCICKDSDCGRGVLDPCDPNPCENGGSCVEDQDYYVCICAAPFTGPNCLEVLSCAEPCENGGTCKWNGEKMECENPCEPNPCENGGTCTIISSSYECTCADLFIGQNCAHKLEITSNTTTYSPITSISPSPVIDFCYEKPCQNGGTCVSQNTGYQCICLSDYSGEDCTEVSISPSTNEDTTTVSFSPTTNDGTTTVSISPTTIEDTTTVSISPTNSEGTTTVSISPTTIEDTTTVSISPTTSGDTTTGSMSPATSEDTTTESMSPITNVGTTIVSISSTTSKDTTTESKSTTTSVDTTIEPESTATSKVTTTIYHDLCTSSPCLNNGSCISIDNSIRCNCTYPFSGDFCGTDLSEKNQSSSSSIVYACTGSAGAVVFVFLIGFSVLWHLKRVKRRKKESYFHNADLSSMESENSRTYII